MTRKQLITISVVSDILDVLVIGQIPGVGHILDIPLVALHVWYAGPQGLTTILELVPVVGTLPIFTVAAFTHPNDHR